jgi:hypothetical protein
MAMNSIADVLISELFAGGDAPESPQVYAVVDGARDVRVEPMLRLSRRDYTPLFSGKLTPKLLAASPFVVHLAQASAFTRELIDFVWERRGCGYFVVAQPEQTLQQVRRHFRNYLRVQDEAGKRYLFRFYDPRVVRVYLPTCTLEEGRSFFGPLTRILCEPERGEAWVEFTPTPAGLRGIPRVPQTA